MDKLHGQNATTMRRRSESVAKTGFMRLYLILTRFEIVLI